jgi:hypothetical protein
VHGQQEAQRDLAVETEAAGIAGADPLARDSISSTKTLGIPIVTLVISPEAEIAREDPRQNVADITADGQAAHSLVIQYNIMKEDAVDAVEPRVSFKERVNIFVTKTANAVKNTGNRAKMYLILTQFHRQTRTQQENERQSIQQTAQEEIQGWKTRKHYEDPASSR